MQHAYPEDYNTDVSWDSLQPEEQQAWINVVTKQNEQWDAPKTPEGANADIQVGPRGLSIGEAVRIYSKHPGEILRFLRAAVDERVEAVAEGTGIAATTLRRYEEGKGSPTLPELLTLTKHFRADTRLMLDACIDNQDALGNWLMRDFVRVLADAVDDRVCSHEVCEARAAARVWLADWGECTSTERDAAIAAFENIMVLVEHDSPVYMVAAQEHANLCGARRGY